MVAPELQGPVLDIACGRGRIRALLEPGVTWVGIDASASQVGENPYSPVILGDMTALPVRDSAVKEALHLWCLYHVDDPVAAIAEARRVLRPGGRYFAATAARNNDPEIMWEGYPPSPFDAEEAPSLVGAVFDDIAVERWDAKFFALETRDEVRAYCRHNFIPIERADTVDVPLWLTKRGVLIRATKR